jgi:regulator of sigma E protease
VDFVGHAFWVVILLGVMILVHELGHFWAALAVGIKVETFSIGFGPRLFGIRRGETDFRLSAVPIGGYVSMLGQQALSEPEDESKAKDPRSFQSKPRWQRAVVIVAGPLMNVILAIAIVAGLYTYAYPKQSETGLPVITAIAPDSAAAEAGLQPGDKIIQLGSDKHPTWDYVLTQEALSANHPLHGVVDRHGERIPFTVVPHMDPRQGIGVAGWSGEQNVQVQEVMENSPAAKAGLQPGDLFITVNERPVVSPLTIRQAVTHSGGKPVTLEIMRKGRTETLTIAPRATKDPKLPYQIGITFKLPVQWVKLAPGEALAQSWQFNKDNALMVFQVLRGLVERRISPKSLSGPIGISQMASQAAEAGAYSYLLFMAFVSLQLAVFNLLPIPILDGGTLLMLIIEMLLQREVSLKMKETIFKLGFVFLMMLVVFVIYNDISKILTNS